MRRARRLVVGNVAAIPNASVHCIYAANFTHLLGNFIERAYLGKVSLLMRNLQFRVDGSVEVPAHPSLVAAGVVVRKRPPLPVQVIVHVKHVHILQADALPIDALAEDRILAARTTGENPSRRVPLPVVLLHFFDHRLGHFLIDHLRRSDDSQLGLGLGMGWKVRRWNSAPLEQLLLCLVSLHSYFSISRLFRILTLCQDIGLRVLLGPTLDGIQLLFDQRDLLLRMTESFGQRHTQIDSRTHTLEHSKYPRSDPHRNAGELIKRRTSPPIALCEDCALTSQSGMTNSNMPQHHSTTNYSLRSIECG